MFICWQLGTTYQILLKKASVPADALRFLVETGYELHRDPSFHVTSIPHPAAYSDPELRVFLQERHENIPHLSQLCRVFIRQHLSLMSPGGSIVPLVSSLPIPALLQDYVRCSTASQRPSWQLLFTKSDLVEQSNNANSSQIPQWI